MIYYPDKQTAKINNLLKLITIQAKGILPPFGMNIATLIFRMDKRVLYKGGGSQTKPYLKEMGGVIFFAPGNGWYTPRREVKKRRVI